VIEPLRSLAARSASVGPAIAIQGLCKRFGALVVAGGFDLEVAAGTLHSFIGPNGAGKTTFFNMLSGIVASDAGKITLLGTDVTTMKVEDRVRLGLARSFQIISVFDHLTVFENVRVAVQSKRPGRSNLFTNAYADPSTIARTWSVLAACGLVAVAGSNSSELSHGQKRLLEMAITIAAGAEVLLLDEPLAGLQEADRHRVTGLIKQLALTHTVLLIEHDIDRVLEISDRIIVLHQGALIADGTPAHVAAHPEVARAYMGKQAIGGEAPVALRSERGAGTRGATLLQLKSVSAGYGGGQVLAGVDLVVGAGEVVALLGRNGVGKTTLLKTIMGLAAVSEGEVLLGDQSLRGLLPHQINRRGVAIVPEGRRLFGNLTVLENLAMARRDGGAGLDEVFEAFPKLRSLKDRAAEHLSGGERQMVAIARALMAPSRVILLDEPFEGLAPTIVADVMDAIVRLRQTRSVILVEHQVHKVLPIADHVYVLVNGRIAYDGSAAALSADTDLQNELLGVAAKVDKTELVG
jgi:branched-chain amino acid transport system ATP-binding protein